MSNLPKATQHTYKLGASAQAHLQSVTRVTLLAGALCLAAHSIAQDAVLTSSGIGYTTNNGTATIVHYAISVANDTSATGALVIPSTLEGIPVTGIGPHAIRKPTTSGFYPIGTVSASGPTTVFIPAGITNIHASAFSSAWDLTSIDIHRANPAYRSIDGILFTKDLTMLLRCPLAREGDFTIPHDTVDIATEAFSGCSSLTTVSLPAGLVSIGANAFSDCRNLVCIAIPDSVTTIESGAFSSCYNLTSVRLPSGINAIGPQTFGRCLSLTDISIPASVTSIAAEAFVYCGSLRTINLPPAWLRSGPGPLADATTSPTLSWPPRTLRTPAWTGCFSRKISPSWCNVLPAEPVTL